MYQCVLCHAGLDLQHISQIAVRRAWLHTCLHLLVQLHQRYVGPEAFTPPPANLFWDPALLQDSNTQLSDIYRWADGSWAIFLPR